VIATVWIGGEGYKMDLDRMLSPGERLRVSGGIISHAAGALSLLHGPHLVVRSVPSPA
jgi:hypothetical protein